MLDLSTTYMGIPLKNPIMAGASKLTGHLDVIKKIEASGAGAIVVKSLFEEEIQFERLKLDEDLDRYTERNPEMVSLFPGFEHAGPKEHLLWLEKVKKSVSIPVIASLNAVYPETWVEYAKLLAETGVDGLELNFYSIHGDLDKDAAVIEREQIEVLKAVKKAVSIPVSVKLSTFYSNPVNFISRLDKAGAGAIVLFNRFFQPDIDILENKNLFPLNLSHSEDYRLPLRFAGLLHGKIKSCISCNTGIFEGEDVVKMMLAGACTVQVVSALFKNGVQHIETMLASLENWMKAKGHQSLKDFRGAMSEKNNPEPWVYTRAQYVTLLLNPEKYMEWPKQV